MLKSGARIAVVAPAGIFHPDKLAAGMALAESWGYVLIPAPNLSSRHRYTAGDVATRAADLTWALTDPGIDAVWFARGGYGTAQLLPHLPWKHLDNRPIIGFSDATALLVQRPGAGVHGPVLNALASLNDQPSQQALADLLAGKPASLSGFQVAGPAREVRAPLTGGNLTVLASLCGTPWAWSAAGRIAVLEDVGEPPYRLDRSLSQLIAAGALDGVIGVALGEFVDCRPPEGAGWTLQEVLLDLLAPLNVPVVAGLPVGHGPNNHAWPVGAEASLHAEGLDVGGC